MAEKGKGKSLELMQKRMQAMGAAPPIAMPQPQQPPQQSQSVQMSGNSSNQIPSPIQKNQYQNPMTQQPMVQPKGKPDSFAQQAARHQAPMVTVQNPQANAGNINHPMHSMMAGSTQHQQQNFSSVSVPGQGGNNYNIPGLGGNSHNVVMQHAPAPSNPVNPTDATQDASSANRRRSITSETIRTEVPNESEGRLAALSNNAPMVGQKMRDLLKSIDPAYSLDAETEQQILVMADEFVERLVSQSFELAKHRGSQQMEVKDVQLSLIKNWGIQIPGLSNPVQPRPSNPLDWALNHSRSRFSSSASITSTSSDRSSAKRKSIGGNNGSGKKASTNTHKSSSKNAGKMTK